MLHNYHRETFSPLRCATRRRGGVRCFRLRRAKVALSNGTSAPASERERGLLMYKATRTAAAIGVIGSLIASQAQAESADSAATEIALLKKQLRLMEEKLDKLQKQTTANTAAAADAKAKANDAKAKADAKLVSAAAN